MKCLTITVDDRTLFSGEIAEISWTETSETVTITGRFAPAPSFLQSLQQMAAAKQAPPPPPEPDGSPAKLSVVPVDEPTPPTYIAPEPYVPDEPKGDE